MGTRTTRSTAHHKRNAIAALAGTHSAIGGDPPAGRGPFPKHRPVVLPMVRYGLPKPAGHGHLRSADGDLMHHQYRLWNPGPARRTPTQIIASTCGRFHSVILQEASDHVHHISDQSSRTQVIRTSPSCSARTLLSPNLAAIVITEASSSKDTRGTVLLVVRGLLRRPSLSGSPTVTLCSVHIHKVVAKKRDASADLLCRLHAHMLQHNIDFIGGDFHMSAFSTVGDQSFRLQATLSCGSLVLWRTRIVSALGFSSCPNVRTNGMWMRTAATAHLPVFLHLRTTNFPWNVKPLSMSVDNAAEDSPSLQPPNVLLPPLRETQRVLPPCCDSSLWCTSLLGLTHAFNEESMKQTRAMLHNKIT